eukprot:m.1019511 g.1019511  ORF g.1019511 m.1019511 type:complete len:68 (+) comp24087_c0_seq18:914-1117(+)
MSAPIQAAMTPDYVVSHNFLSVLIGALIEMTVNVQTQSSVFAGADKRVIPRILTPKHRSHNCIVSTV